MEFTGQVINVAKDWVTGKFHITFSVNEDAAVLTGYDKIKSLQKLLIHVTKFRNKRSKNANAYMWDLLQKIAEETHSDKWSVYIKMLSEYGVFTHISVIEEAVERVKSEWRACTELGEILENGEKRIQLQCYFGSSTYNTKEMSVLIDGVVREAQELGIETKTPNQIEEMKQRWGIEISHPK